jgi:tRNA threonylcarbamoyladenosine biosynthesis protein TsaE
VIAACGPERAGDIHRLTQAAFARHQILEPPSGAGRESLEQVAADLARGGGAVADMDGRPVGCLRWDLPESGDFHVRRVAVDPALQGRGLGRALMSWAESEAARRGHAGVTVGVRIALPGNIAFYRRLGYEITGEHCHEGFAEPTWFSMRKRLAGQPPGRAAAR